jgi:hypothetical protein
MYGHTSYSLPIAFGADQEASGVYSTFFKPETGLNPERCSPSNGSIDVAHLSEKYRFIGKSNPESPPE